MLDHTQTEIEPHHPAEYLDALRRHPGEWFVGGELRAPEETETPKPDELPDLSQVREERAERAERLRQELRDAGRR